MLDDYTKADEKQKQSTVKAFDTAFKEFKGQGDNAKLQNDMGTFLLKVAMQMEGQGGSANYDTYKKMEPAQRSTLDKTMNKIRDLLQGSTAAPAEYKPSREATDQAATAVREGKKTGGEKAAPAPAPAPAPTQEKSPVEPAATDEANTAVAPKEEDKKSEVSKESALTPEQEALKETLQNKLGVLETAVNNGENYQDVNQVASLEVRFVGLQAEMKAGIDLPEKTNSVIKDKINVLKDRAEGVVTLVKDLKGKGYVLKFGPSITIEQPPQAKPVGAIDGQSNLADIRKQLLSPTEEKPAEPKEQDVKKDTTVSAESPTAPKPAAEAKAGDTDEEVVTASSDRQYTGGEEKPTIEKQAPKGTVENITDDMITVTGKGKSVSGSSTSIMMAERKARIDAMRNALEAVAQQYPQLGGGDYKTQLEGVIRGAQFSQPKEVDGFVTVEMKIPKSGIQVLLDSVAKK
jgi:hypothetical protein